MITRIREVRKAKKLTLEQVAARCDPPTTAQTVGRLETGTRTVSVGWLNRIAGALGVDAADLVDHPERAEMPVLCQVGADGARALNRQMELVAPRPAPGQVGVIVTGSVGDYRHGDELWCDRIEADAYASALNRDVIIPRPAGRFLFGRLIGRESGKLQLLPFGAGGRQQVVTDPPFIAVVMKLVRGL